MLCGQKSNLRKTSCGSESGYALFTEISILSISTGKYMYLHMNTLTHEHVIYDYF